jgi:L-iditol 2-dehydrogenase
MRAALLQAERQLVMIEAEPPVLEQPDQVIIQVKTVGVCGSELHAFYGTHPYRKAPVILGHEAAGDVVAVGSTVTAFKPGDRVIVDPQWTCGECEHCRAGDINLCPAKKVMGTANWPGALGEYVSAPQTAVFPLPANLSYEQGSLIEPLTVAVHVTQRANVQPGDTVAILGTGSIGGLLSGVCRARSASTIITADVKQHCLDAARERLGATHDFLLPDRSFTDRVMQLTRDRGVDAVFITADDSALVNTAIEIAARRGRLVLVALLTDAPLRFAAYPLIRKELSVLGSIMSSHADVRAAIELAASRRVDVHGIVTHRLPIEQAQRGFELAHSKDDGAIKVMLTF